IGAALGDDVHDSANGAPEFAAVIAVNHAEFVDGVFRRRGFLDARCRRHIVRAINCHEVVVDVLTGEGQLGHGLDDHIRAARGCVTDGDTRSKQRKVDELASVNGQVLDLLLVNDRAHHGAGRLGYFADVLHCDLFLYLTNGKVEIQASRGPEIKVHLLGLLAEAGLLRSNGVVSRRKRGNLVVAHGRGRSGPRQPGCSVRYGNVRFRQCRTARVIDAALYGDARCLSKTGDGNYEAWRNGNCPPHQWTDLRTWD